MSRGTKQTDSVDGTESANGARGGIGETTRRRLLASGAATWATVALAGCSDSASSDDGGDEGGQSEAENYVVTTETWTGGGVPSSIAFMSSCARSDTFVPGMQMVFFVGIFDPDTGERLTSDDLDGAQVNLGDGMETISLEWTDEHDYATRNEGNNWVGSWDIPEDMEPQSLQYTVEVTGGDASFQNVGVLSDAIEVVEYDDPSNLVVDTETRWNGHPSPEYTNGFVGACAPEREFTPELDVTFVVGMYDSTSGNMVGADGLVDATTGEAVEDEGSEYADGISAATVVSSDGAFDDVSLEWTAALDDDNGFPRWFGTLETENLDPGTYGYEVQIDDEDTGRFDTGVASAQFSIIEVPE